VRHFVTQVFARIPIDLEEITTPRGKVYIIPERCKECELCIVFCPEDVLYSSDQTNAKGYHYPDVVAGKEESCVHCEFCSLVCPEFAIYTLAVTDG
jgi:2-oxoglutarate ferredoxin oxidoreductase subunit delta